MQDKKMIIKQKINNKDKQNQIKQLLQSLKLNDIKSVLDVNLPQLKDDTLLQLTHLYPDKTEDDFNNDPNLFNSQVQDLENLILKNLQDIYQIYFDSIVTVLMDNESMFFTKEIFDFIQNSIFKLDQLLEINVFNVDITYKNDSYLEYKFSFDINNEDIPNILEKTIKGNNMQLLVINTFVQSYDISNIESDIVYSQLQFILMKKWKQ